MAHYIGVVVLLAVLVSAVGVEVSKYVVSSVSYNPDSSFSGRIDRFLNGDQSPPKAAFSQEKHYPLYAYKPNCSVEFVIQTWTLINSQLPVFGELEIAIPTVTKSKSWKCFYRSSWLNDGENIPPETKILPNERYLTTLVYCPSMYAEGDDGRVGSHSAGSSNHMSNFGMCPLLNKAIAKEGGNHINLILQLLNLPKVLLHKNSPDKALQVGPVALKGVTKRSRVMMTTSTRFTTNTLDKVYVQVISRPVFTDGSDSGADVSTAEDKCAAEWDSLTLVGRCFGLKTHTEYPELKQIPLVADASQCKALCCQLGPQQCVSWQYWVDIKLCKLGGAVRVGKEHADTNFWCDSEPPITWSGEKLQRLPSGKPDPDHTPENLPTQCFGLGNERFKLAPSQGASPGATKKERMSVAECREECRANRDCGIWQAHARRGCYYGPAADIYCEPYAGRYTGGRRMCNDKCSK